MPKYKKKRRSRIFSTPKRVSKTAAKSNFDNGDIKMTPSKRQKAAPQKPDNLRVITGKKLERRRKMKAGFCSILVIAGVITALEFLLPAGIIQTFSNLTALLGTGGYPISVSGSQTLDVKPFGNYFYYLSDTHVAAYSNSGKELFSHAHGFERPVLKVSHGRALVYDQGGKQVQIFDLKGLKSQLDTEQEIITAAISDSGNYAVTTYSEKYASAVSVYNKRNRVIYEWYSAGDVVNNVAISSNGKKIAVTTYNSDSGVFNSKLNIINFESATPEFTKSYEREIIYDLKNSSNIRFCVIKAGGIDYIKWSKHLVAEYKNDYRISLFCPNNALDVAVFCRDSDKTDNNIVVFSKNGKIKANIRYKGLISDIQSKGRNIYCINDTEISVVDFEGKLSHSLPYGFGGSKIVITATDLVAVVSDSEIKSIKLDEMGDR